MRITKPIILLLSLLLVGCPDDGSPTLAAAETDTDGLCTPGTEACECIEGGQCVAGLVCASNLCVDIDGSGGADESGMKPDDMTSSGPGDETGAPVGSCEGNCGGSDMDGERWCYCTPACEFAGDCCPDYEDACPGACIYSYQCGGQEVCSAGQECVSAYGHVYEMTVKRWLDHTDTCWDVLDCYADVYFKVFYGDEGEVHRSTTRPNTTNASWEDEPFYIEINATDVMVIVFYDFDDASSDDTMNSVCFNPGGGACGPVGVDYLQVGGADWHGNFTVEVSFVSQ